jgi:hypothetical protein
LKNYKANVIVKKGKKEQERILWIRRDHIVDALNVTHKVKAIKINYIHQISEEEYIRGVAHA